MGNHHIFYGWKKPKKLFHFLAVFSLFLFAPALYAAEGYDCLSPENRDKHARVEITLAKKWKKKKKEVIAAFQNGEAKTPVRINFFPFLEPPMNVGIGRCTTAEEARLALQNAINFNQGVEHVILQNLIPHHWIGIGTTKLAELSWKPINADELKLLMDPVLGTEAFHKLYNEFAQMKERQLPFGFDPIPYEGPDKDQTTPLRNSR